jgi:putative NADPH-quinone reductase
VAGAIPALVKAFFEQMMRPGIAFEYQKQGFPQQLLKKRSARLVVTMGMTALIYRRYFGGHAARVRAQSAPFRRHEASALNAVWDARGGR